MCRFLLGDSFSCKCPWTLMQPAGTCQQGHVRQEQWRLAGREQRSRGAVHRDRQHLVDPVHVVVAEHEPLGPRRLPPPCLVCQADAGVNAYIAQANDRVVDVDQLVPGVPHRLVHVVRRPERPVEGS